jgi:hypothetical protein
MANPLKMTRFDLERRALLAEGCAGTVDLAQVREPQEPLCGECPSGRYLEDGR